MDDRSLYGTPEAPQPPKDRGPLLHRVLPRDGPAARLLAAVAAHDGVAGVTVAALALPSGMAVRGSSPASRRSQASTPCCSRRLAYALLGSSRQLIVGPEGALAVLVATAVAPLAGTTPRSSPRSAAMLAVLVGRVAAVAWIVRLGWISDYFSRSVLVGYIHGVAIVLIIGQLGKLLGLSIDADDPLPQLAEVVRELGDAHGLTVVVALVSLILLLVLRWRFPKVPGALIVVVGGIIVSAAFGLADEGVKVVGNIPSGLPSLAWPNVSLDDATQLLPAAVGIFAVGYADAILTARSFAGRHNENVDANQELLALGAANAAAGVSQAFPVGASGSRTAVSDQMGGKTQLVGVIAAAVIALVLLFFTAPVESCPARCLGAVIVAAGIGLIEPKAWRALAQISRFEVVIAAVTFVGVLVLGVLVALAGRGRTVDRRLHRSERQAPRCGAGLGAAPRPLRERGAPPQRPPDARRRSSTDSTASSSSPTRSTSPAGARSDRRRATETRWVVLDAEGMNGIDASGSEALEQLVNGLRGRGIGARGRAAEDPGARRLRRVGLTGLIGADRFPPSVEAGVEQCAVGGLMGDLGETGPTDPGRS